MEKRFTENKFAAVDVGSNTVRLLIAKAAKDRDKFTPLRLERIITRLGENFEPDKTLKMEPVERTVNALNHFKNIIDSEKVSKRAISGTAVIREAQNRNWFIDLVTRKTGLSMKVLSGIEEAQLSLKGVFNAIQITSPPALVIDIGGGSTELVIANPSIPPEIILVKSFPLGAVKLTETFLVQDPPGIDACKKVREKIRDIITPSLTANNQFASPKTIVATAGTPTTLAAIRHRVEQYDPKKITGTVLTVRWLEEIASRLAVMPTEKRARIVGLEKGREDIILAGTLILIEITNCFRTSEVFVCDPGLLEGLIWDLIDPNPLVKW